LELLAGLQKPLELALAGTEAGTELLEAFAPCSYVAVDFPDFTGELRTDRIFLSRLRVAIDFYRERLEAALRSLRS